MLPGMGGVVLEDTLSNLTSAISNEASISSSTNITEMATNPRQQYNPSQPPPKRRRNLPGNPDPEAEVVALSPHALMATNRFVCEICNKGFQRDQNLQLHRRGHNLPWKLKQRNKLEVIRKKVYVCPEPSCVHHDPARALGDLTGIKKHFSRKHGEKKWKCEKCSKRYAVQSDWKAHSKICGTREYRCDCGTLFSRRDSFITHRAFCDALAEESSRSISQNPILSSQTAPNQIHGFHIPLLPLKQEANYSLPPWLSPEPGSMNPVFTENPNPSFTTTTSLMSATALLQKAAQMGVTMSAKMGYDHHDHVGAAGFGATTSTGGMGSRDEIGTGFLHGLASYGNKLANLTSGCMDLHDMNMVGASLPSTSGFDGSLAFDQDGFQGRSHMQVTSSSFASDSFNGILNPKKNMVGGGGGGSGGGATDGMTRDFLGLRAFPHRDFSNMAGFDQMGSSTYDHQNQNNQAPWQS